jgi:hypothetical protein
VVFNPRDPIGNQGDVPPQVANAIGEIFGMIAAMLIANSTSFREGNPSAFNIPTDVKDVEIRATIQLAGRGVRKPRIIALPEVRSPGRA